MFQGKNPPIIFRLPPTPLAVLLGLTDDVPLPPIALVKEAMRAIPFALSDPKITSQSDYGRRALGDPEARIAYLDDLMVRGSEGGHPPAAMLWALEWLHHLRAIAANHFDAAERRQIVTRPMLWKWWRDGCRFADDAADAKDKRVSKRTSRRGAPTQYDESKDRRLLDDWQAAKSAGASRESFCRERGLTIKDIIAAQDRDEYRRQRDAE